MPRRTVPSALLLLVLCLLLSLLPTAAAAQTPTPPFAGLILKTANVRAGPGTTYATVAQLQTGAAVQVRQCNADCTWYLIGNQQWVAAFLIGAAPAPAAAPAASSLGAVSLSHPARTSIVMVTWNAGLDDAELDEIAAQVSAFDGVDLWTIQEARGAGVTRALEAAAEAGEGANFSAVLGTTGADIKLLTLYNDDRFDLLGTEELHHINTTGNARAPLVLHLSDTVSGVGFKLLNNHLYRSREDERDRQATLLAEWALTQSLPIIAGGDHNFDYDVPDGPQPADQGFANMTAGGAWVWVQPSPLIPTQCTDHLPCTYDDILDFVFVAGPARDWAADSLVVVRPGDQPDNATISDHRPVAAVFDPTTTTATRSAPLVLPLAQPTLAPTPVLAQPTLAPTPVPAPLPLPLPAVQERTQTIDACDPSYPDVCIPPAPPDLDCGDISYRRFRVIGADPHRFDGNHDGVGCEGN